MGIGKSYKGGATQANYGNTSGCSVDKGNGMEPCNTKKADDAKKKRAAKQPMPLKLNVKF